MIELFPRGSALPSRWAATWLSALFIYFCLIGGTNRAYACSGDPGDPFRKLLKDRESVAIVRILEQELKDAQKDVRIDDPSGIPAYILSPTKVVARVELSEVILANGDTPKLKEIHYANHWCGGHRLDAGGYYIVVVDASEEKLKLGFGDQSVLGLGVEYSEADGSDRSWSLIIKAVKEYGESGVFPDESELPLAPFLALVTKGFDAPSSEIYLRRRDGGDVVDQ